MDARITEMYAERKWMIKLCNLIKELIVLCDLIL